MANNGAIHSRESGEGSGENAPGSVPSVDPESRVGAIATDEHAQRVESDFRDAFPRGKTLWSFANGKLTPERLPDLTPEEIAAFQRDTDEQQASARRQECLLGGKPQPAYEALADVAEPVMLIDGLMVEGQPMLIAGPVK
jgi:hypothetical protein